MSRRSHPRPPVSPAALNAPGEDAMWTNLGDWSSTTQYGAAAVALAARVGAAAALEPNDVVVDYACGYGDSLRLWIERFGVRRVVGIEPDATVCRRVEARIAAWGLTDRIRVVASRAEALSPREADADVTAVVCVDAAYHFRSRVAWWQMLARDLPTGARIAATDLVLGNGARAGVPLRAIAWAMDIPPENLVDTATLQQSLAPLPLQISSTSLGQEVLDGFAQHATATAAAVRATRAALGWARRTGLVEYLLLAARCQSHGPSSAGDR